MTNNNNDGVNQGAKIAGIGVGLFFGLLALLLLIIIGCCVGMPILGAIGNAG